MVIEYFNYAHILTVLGGAAFFCALYFPFCNCSQSTKKGIIYIVMVTNLFQHLFKFAVWPHLWGSGFGLQNTAYNECALMIIISPFVFFKGGRLTRQLVTYVGFIGAAMAVCLPDWQLGTDILNWEYLRYLLCHYMLLSSSLLQGVWGFTKIRWQDFYKLPLMFLLTLVALLANNTIFLTAFGYNSPDLYSALVNEGLNPLWIMGPPQGKYQWVVQLINCITPPIFRGERYAPVLWYALPVFAATTFIALVAGAVFDGPLQTKKAAAPPRPPIQQYLTNHPAYPQKLNTYAKNGR